MSWVPSYFGVIAERDYMAMELGRVRNVDATTVREDDALHRIRDLLLRLRKLRPNSLEMQVLPLHLHLPSLLTLIGLQTQGRLLI